MTRFPLMEVALVIEEMEQEIKGVKKQLQVCSKGSQSYVYATGKLVILDRYVGRLKDRV